MSSDINFDEVSMTVELVRDENGKLRHLTTHNDSKGTSKFLSDPLAEVPCMVFWGSHGCDLERGHGGHHRCDCCKCEDHAINRESGCVGSFPYYGEGTEFYGEDANAQ